MAASKVKKPSKWSLLVAEATKDDKVREPYEFDAVEPSIFIEPPENLERALTLAELVDTKGDVDVAKLKPMLEALVGPENFPAIWEVLGKNKIKVTLAFIDDLNDHFNGGADNGAEDLPGEDQDS